MSNFQVYRKILSFSLVEFLLGVLALAAMGGLAVLGYVIADPSGAGPIGAVLGFIVGIIAAVLIKIFLTNRIKAAQIAMITRGVTKGDLPDHTFGEGFKQIKGRFGSITLFFLVTNQIKGAFRQLGRLINRVGTAVGGEAGNAITSAIDSAVQVLLSYLTDCCLGWVFYRSEKNAAAAACEGAAIFFKHGKTLFRNAGRIFGMGLLSFLVIGGAFTGVFYLIASNFPSVFARLGSEVAEAAVRLEKTIPAYITEPGTMMLIASALAAVILWSILHSAFVRPFVLVGVLRNYIQSGMQSVPSEASFAMLDSKSDRFRKLHGELA